MGSLRFRYVAAALGTGAITVAAFVVAQDEDDESVRPVGTRGHCDRVVAEDADVEHELEDLAEGESACLAQGVHAADGTVKLTAAGASIRSAPGEHATLQASLWVSRGADGTTIEGLRINGKDADGAPSLIVSADDVVFRRNEITNEHTGICFAIGDGPGRSADVVIEANRVHDCGELPPTNHHHGIYVVDATGTVIRDNWIYDNADRGIQLYPNADDSMITGNVIDGNGVGIIFSGDGTEASEGNVVKGNAITNSRARFNIEAFWGDELVGSGNVVTENCVYGGARGDVAGGIEPGEEGFEAADNVVADPRYADRGAGDFRISAESPCAEVLG